MISAVVLCGGGGRRFRGEDKPLISLRGRPMIEHVLARLTPQVDEIVISANRNQAAYARYGHLVVGDAAPDMGPLAGIAAAADACAGELLFTCPGDSPMLPADLVARLVAELEASGEAVVGVVARDGDRDQPLFCLLRTAAAVSIRDYLVAGGRSVHGWQAELPFARCVIDAPEAFINVNTPGDLAALEACWNNAGG